MSRDRCGGNFFLGPKHGTEDLSLEDLRMMVSQKVEFALSVSILGAPEPFS
jgi:hypothetical protein